MSNQDYSDKIESALGKAKLFLIKKYKLSLQDVEDITQNAAVNALKKLDSFRGECSFDTWFIQIAHNLAKDFFNLKYKKYEIGFDNVIQDKILPSYSEPEIYSSNKRAEYSYLINEAMKEISEKQRKVIELMLNNANSTQEIADILEIPISSVRTRFFHAKKKLQKIIKKNAYQSNIQLFNH